MKKRSLQKVGLIAILLAALALVAPYFLRRPAPAPEPKPAPKEKVEKKRKRAPRKLTDVAPPPREVNAQGRDLEALDLPPQPEENVILPDDFDPSNPPKFTETLAKPNLNPTPPDPFKEPEMKVDPRRVKPEDQE